MHIGKISSIKQPNYFIIQINSGFAVVLSLSLCLDKFRLRVDLDV